MIEFRTIEDVTRDNILKALEEIKEEYRPIEHIPDEIIHSKSQDEIIQFYRERGCVTIEEYMENARNKYGL